MRLTMNSLKDYKDVRGTLVRKYCNLFGQYLLVFEENGAKTTVRVGKALYDQTKVGTQWTIGHIGRMLINIRPGLCEDTDGWTND